MASIYKVERISPEEIALGELSSYPTTFIVPFGEEPYAWERGIEFFKNYTEDAFRVSENSDGSITLSNQDGDEDRYQYEIRKQTTNGGYNYKVSCLLKNKDSDSQHVNVNARNLARFVREGRLELSVLDR